ncbi:HlyD family type I secretion periplasmic adaptor subunit [Sphingomonas sp. LaA6.9]|uniref:HlyD family type I secretion periplasmic adaptor subunit n=1 Tax=Sphingomonas sp. LaA6.9 TaxID=2919914 RepID=UPI001F50106A|nr:HlyD family type I secretion periplasmic adaptor subunit [Sphingomonas sp. LaA6.9]MCJ8159625.1 HlyD family type I secretion periplasmic adaptor subunit [Sphingomonas sp. LaA6.9]
MFGRLANWFRGLSGSGQIIVTSAVGMALFLLWASLAQVDEVTRGQGRVIPSSKAQIVQAAEPTTIDAILVRSGQRVRKGQLLVRLDDTQSASELGQIAAETRSLEARAARLGREGGVGGGTDCAPGANGQLPAECAQEAALQEVRQSALRSRLSGMSAAVEQRRREYAEAQATIASLRSSVQLAQDQVNMLAPLAAKSIVPQTELLSAQRELVDLRGRLAAAQQSASRAAAGVNEAQAQASEANFQFRQEALNERSQLSAKIAMNTESLRGAEGRVQRSEIRSPVNGVVNDVQVTTIGGFVNAGQKIMQVVPMGDKLLIEARVTPKDIAFIKMGDRANVKVTAYDFSIYGGLTGKVVQVSADSIYDEAAKEAYFTVIVETDKAYLMSAGKQLPITPGMICDVEIITGRKSVLSYLLKPVLKARSEALGER